LTVTFELYPTRFAFTALDSLFFPAGKPGNILRGAFGTIFRKIACVPECPGLRGGSVRDCELRDKCAYARLFEPASVGKGPSGLADWPRPFVFRASRLDGQTIAAGDSFHFDLHIFEMRDPALPFFVLAFAQIASEGLGPGRGRAKLVAVHQLDDEGAPFHQVYDGVASLIQQPAPPLVLDLEAPAEPVGNVRVRFVTPTELKSGHRLADRPDFASLFGRIRDRLSTLRALYGAGPLSIDFRGMGERAARVQMTRCDLQWVSAARRSAKTGQIHPLGGFVGQAEYEGELGRQVDRRRAAHGLGERRGGGNVLRRFLIRRG
jgi:hypothetical protein